MNSKEDIINYNINDLKGILHKNIKLSSNIKYTELTSCNGFDCNNLINGKQNNYAWSMCDFNGYIYVGTGRNLPLVSFSVGLSGLISPTDYNVEPDKFDMTAEIWRYKKDGTLPWQRVYKAKYIETKDPQTGKKKLIPEIVGFRSIIKFDSFSLKPALYAAAYSIQGVKVLKSVDGCNWFNVGTNIQDGTSSRSLIEYNGKIYMPVMTDGTQTAKESIVYSSKDPELYGWEKVPTTGAKGKNPIGTVWSIAEFNNRLYLGTASDQGFMVWRTNSPEPKADDWTLVIDKGGGNSKNAIAMTLTVFNNYLYVGSAYDVSDPTVYVTPKGADIFRIDAHDNWDVIVGEAEKDSFNFKRQGSLSNFYSGFNNPYNIYIWQMTVYNNKLYVGTYDSSISVEPTLELFIINEQKLKSLMGDSEYELSLNLLKFQVKFLSLHQNLLGFELYSSSDGIHFEPISFNGFNDPYNYGVRRLIVSDDNRFFLGTANPFQGCKVYELKEKNKNNCMYHR